MKKRSFPALSALLGISGLGKMDCFQDGIYCFIGTSRQASVDALYPAERAAIQYSVEKRRAEFATGRWCARQALMRLGRQPQALPPGADRIPVWPEGVSGSISHTQGYTCALVAKLAVGLGVDVERLDRDVSQGTWDLILGDCEQRRFQSPAEKLMAFSAKEAFCKAASGRMTDFNEVEVLVGKSPGELVVKAKKPLGGFPAAGEVHPVRFVITTDFVLTWTALPV